MKKRHYTIFGCLLLLALLLLGCSGENEADGSVENNENIENQTKNNNNNDNEDDPLEGELEEVTLYMVTHWDDAQFEHNFKSHVEEKFPHITLEHIHSRYDELEENVFAKNLRPDILMNSVSDYLIEIDLLLDLYPLIEKFGFDLDRLEPGIMGYLKDMSNVGELNGLPLIRPEYALVYNPDIFDLFGVPYPTDGMTWDEIIELASKVTGEMNGVHYRGLHSGSYHHKMTQLEDSLLVDPETHEPIIDQNENYRLYLERLQAILNIPGNGFETVAEWKDTRGVDLLREGFLAMTPERAFTGAYINNYLDSGINFDFVTYPIWGGEHGDYGPNEPGNGLVITNLTEHPGEAFRVVEYFLSDEYQSWQASQGNLPAVISPEVRGAFMKEHEHYDILQEKNLEAILSMEAAPIPITSAHQGEIMAGVDFREGLISGEDVNTVIRKMQDQAEANAKNVLSRQ